MSIELEAGNALEKFKSYFKEDIEIDPFGMKGKIAIYDLVRVGEQGYQKVRLYSENKHNTPNSEGKSYKETIHISYENGETSNYQKRHVELDVFEVREQHYLTKSGEGHDYSIEEIQANFTQAPLSLIDIISTLDISDKHLINPDFFEHDLTTRKPLAVNDRIIYHDTRNHERIAVIVDVLHIESDKTKGQILYKGRYNIKIVS